MTGLAEMGKNVNLGHAQTWTSIAGANSMHESETAASIPQGCGAD